LERRQVGKGLLPIVIAISVEIAPEEGVSAISKRLEKEKNVLEI
jgi:hypothetical protein